MPTLTIYHRARPDKPRPGRNGEEFEIQKPIPVQIAPNQSGPPTKAEPIIGLYKFAFWSVVGAAGGGSVNIENWLSFTATTADVVAKAWYVYPGAKPKSGSGVFVDAFDLESGTFIDDAFALVTNADQTFNPTLSTDANVNGLVVTKDTEFVDAKASVEAHSFDRWECVEGAQEAIAGGRLTAKGGTNSQAIAFYRAGRRVWHPYYGEPSAHPAKQSWVSWGAKVDGGGPTGGGPIGPWGPLMMELAAGLTLADAAGDLDPTLRAEALHIASKQVSLASDRLRAAIDAAAKAAAKTKDK